MPTEWYTWAIQGLLTVIGSFVWWDIRRVGRNVHSLRTEIGTIALELEKQIRAVERDVSKWQAALEVVKARFDEAEKWRELILKILERMVPPR